MSDASPVQDNWLVWLVTVVLSGIVSYFTTTGTLQVRLAQLEEREENHYAEILRRLSAIDGKLDRHG